MSRTWHNWTDDEEQKLRDNYNNYSRQELAVMIGVSFNSVKRKAYDLGLKKDKESLSRILKRFPSSHRFEKGHKPCNMKYDGCIVKRITKSGKVYQWIRLEEDVWIMLHIYKWLEAGRKYDPTVGDILRFKDGNTLNTELDNLILITRKENARMNWKAKRDAEQKRLDERNRRKMVILAKRERDAEEKKKLKELKLLQQQEESKKRNELRRQEAEKKKVEQQRLREQEKAAKEKQKQEQRLEKRTRELYIPSRRREKIFETVSIDYSKMVAVRIDHRTIIWAKPGQSPEKIRKQFLAKRDNQIYVYS